MVVVTGSTGLNWRPLRSWADFRFESPRSKQRKGPFLKLNLAEAYGIPLPVFVLSARGIRVTMSFVVSIPNLMSFG